MRSMAASGISDEVPIPEGKVESVCREWLIREDGVLAYKLQTEEIEHHYGHNKERNQLVRSDFKEACTAQKDEDHEAALLQLTYEKMLREQEEHDASIAQQLQEKIQREEMEHQKQVEEEDERIALDLQRKEKLRLQRKREEREMRQAEKARTELATSPSAHPSTDTPHSLEADFVKLNLNFPADLTPEDLQRFQEQHDAELAKMLQEREIKSENLQDRQLAIEAQDRELARVLQEQERAKARKARERAKQKALMQQQHLENNSLESTPSPERYGQHSMERRNKDWQLTDQRGYTSDFSGDHVTNIATAIDPTYNHMGASPPQTLVKSPMTAELSPGSVDEAYYGSPEDESAVPPYMPIQGTRRPSSLEKNKKCKKSKDSCKTQ